MPLTFDFITKNEVIKRRTQGRDRQRLLKIRAQAREESKQVQTRNTMPCYWNKLPTELKISILHLLDTDTALDFCLVNKESAELLQNNQSLPVAQGKLEHLLSQQSDFWQLEVIEDNLAAWRAGDLKISVSMPEAESILHRIAPRLGSSASRILVNVLPREDYRWVETLKRLPPAFTVGLFLDLSRKHFDAIMYKIEGLSDPFADYQAVVLNLPSGVVDLLDMVQFSSDCPSISVISDSLTQVEMCGCDIPNTIVDFSACQNLVQMRLIDCILSTALDNFRYPSNLHRLELESIGFRPPQNQQQSKINWQLPASLKNFQIVDCEGCEHSLLTKLPDNLEEFDSLGTKSLDLKCLELPSRLSKLSLETSTLMDYSSWAFPSSLETFLYVNDGPVRLPNHYDIKFPEGIEIIHINFGNSSSSAKGERRFKAFRKLWHNELQKRHPSAFIAILPMI